MKRVPKKRVKSIAPSVHDLCAILDALHREVPTWRRQRDETIIQVFFYTGLRVSELERLNLEQLDFTGRRICRAHRKGGDMVDVVLNKAAIEALRDWLRTRPESSAPAVFVNRSGGRLLVRAIQKRIGRTPIQPHRYPAPLSPPACV
ncbi:MAG: tyrosine-type recombinase/integrase [Pseudomonadota bacterium]|nr:tyrosine-type recombinase/integrase [Pseudomonadota bacterium]